MVPDNREEKNALLGQMLTSLEFVANPHILGNEVSKRQISHHLANGGLVLIRDALLESVAERMFACLDQFSAWQVFEDYQTNFHYHHHNIYDGALYPPDLEWCRGIFGSELTKSLMQTLSQRDCSGETVFSASWYLPGDYSLPHDDLPGDEGAYRQVAFVWHLSKSWQPHWGGDLFWCQKNRYITPSFNSLILFNVSPKNSHHVTQVSPFAAAKRLAISGWWTSRTENQVGPGDEVAGSTGEQELLELI